MNFQLYMEVRDWSKDILIYSGERLHDRTLLHYQCLQHKVTSFDEFGKFGYYSWKRRWWSKQSIEYYHMRQRNRHLVLQDWRVPSEWRQNLVKIS